MGGASGSQGMGAVAARELLKALMESESVVMVGLDRSGRIRVFNRGAEKATGWKARSALGKDWFSLFIPKESAGSVKRVLRAMFSGRKWAAYHENPVTGKRGRRLIVGWSNRVVAGAGGRMALAIGFDMTPEKKKISDMERKLVNTEDALMSMLSDLNTANKRVMELDQAKDAFVSMTAHELRTPLTPLKSELQMWKAGMYGKLNARQLESVARALANVEREATLVNDILTVSKLESGKLTFMMRPLSVGAVLRAAEAEWRPRAEEKGLRFEVKAQAGLPRVMGDEKRLAQVLSILLDNAIDFTERGGIKIEARKIVVSDTVAVSVSDTGTGIPKEAMSRLFEKFFQADTSLSRAHGGSGLGLAIARGIMEAHGGQLKAESEQGKGSTFTMLLPVFRGGRGKYVKRAAL